MVFPQGVTYPLKPPAGGLLAPRAPPGLRIWLIGVVGWGNGVGGKSSSAGYLGGCGAKGAGGAIDKTPLGMVLVDGVGMMDDNEGEKYIRSSNV